MFSYEVIQNFNDLEMVIYQFINEHKQEVKYMTIRELAEAAHVSTSAIVRFCKKNNCDGYSEFRTRFKMYLSEERKKQPKNGIDEITNFFQIEDPYFPVGKEFENTVVIALSVSGETPETINLAEKLKFHGCKLVSITNKSDCSLAKMSDYNIPYYVTESSIDNEYNVTT